MKPFNVNHFKIKRVVWAGEYNYNPSNKICVTNNIDLWIFARQRIDDIFAISIKYNILGTMNRDSIFNEELNYE